MSSDSHEKLKAALHQFKNEGGFVYSSQHMDAEKLIKAIEEHVLVVVHRAQKRRASR